MEKWDACDEVINLDTLIGRECYAGLDLSTTLDLTAFVLVFPPRNDTEKYRKKIFVSVSDVTMFRMMYGKQTDLYGQQRGM